MTLNFKKLPIPGEGLTIATCFSQSMVLRDSETLCFEDIISKATDSITEYSLIEQVKHKSNEIQQPQLFDSFIV